MQKYLVTITFKYHEAPKVDYSSEDGLIINSKREKKVFIGIYDDFDTACLHGNQLMETLESKFELYTFPDGRKSTRERFSKDGGLFGHALTCISSYSYLITPFYFLAEITAFSDEIETALDEVLLSSNKYREFEKSKPRIIIGL